MIGYADHPRSCIYYFVNLTKRKELNVAITFTDASNTTWEFIGDRSQIHLVHFKNIFHDADEFQVILGDKRITVSKFTYNQIKRIILKK